MKLMAVLTCIGFIACKPGIKYPSGGYDYPIQVADKDTNFYYYPYKDLLSRKDSFNYGSEYLFFKNFNEPNLSIRAAAKDMFRLTYSGWGVKTYIILLTENLISIKSGHAEELYDWDENLLSFAEKEQLRILRRYFPFEKNQQNPFLSHRIDSMIKAEPRLLDPQYYLALTKKENPRNNHPSFDSVTNIHITIETFNHLVDLINTSGFWALPFVVECPDPPTDGDGFGLEANTKNKYQCVHVNRCPDDTSKFTRACQKIIESAHLDKEIHLTWYGVIDTIKHKPLIVQDVQLKEVKKPKHKKH